MTSRSYMDVGCSNVSVLHSIIILTLAVTVVTEADVCYNTPCQKYGPQQPCQFHIGCQRVGLMSKCKVTSMHINKTLPNDKRFTCIAARLVPGFADFCKELVYNISLPSPGPVPIHNGETVTSSGIAKESTMIPESRCFGTTILASIGTGCFLAGCFTMWLVLCCCRFAIHISTQLKDGSDTGVVHDRTRRTSTVRCRDLAGSTSSAHLLSNASVDSLSTHNTLMSTNEGPVSNNMNPSGPSSMSSSATWTESDRQLFSNSRSPSTPWTDTGRSAVANAKTTSRRWTEHGQPSLPRTQPPSAQWAESGQPPFTRTQTHSTPWLDAIYSPTSESSSRDYQSIHGGSENPYAPYSESSSDYSSTQTHRVMIIRDGEIYHPSSESSGSNDYTSLKGQRFNRNNEAIYYPTSEGSNKDYASLAGDRDEEGAFGTDTGKQRNDIRNNVKFNVSGLEFPSQTSCKPPGWASDLQEINEYETVDSAEKGDENEIGITTLADMCDFNHNTDTYSQPHEYFTLETLSTEQ